MVTKQETKIVLKILDYIRHCGGDGWKVHGSELQRAGEPDLDAWIPDPRGGHIHMKLEVKTPTGEPSPLQVHRINTYKRAGYLAEIVTSVDDLKEAINAYTQKPR